MSGGDHDTSSDQTDHLASFRALRYIGYFGLTVSLCEANQREEVRDFGLRTQLNQPQRYGLNDENAYMRTYGNVRKFEYLVASDSATGEIAGDFRLQFDYAPHLRHSNLSMELLQYSKQGHMVVDFGGHIDRRRPDSRQVYKALWIALMRLAKSMGIGALYAQVREFMLTRFLSMGFAQCSTPFVEFGWQGQWIAVWMRMDGAPRGWKEVNYGQEWQALTGVDLDANFWRDVQEALDDPAAWRS